MKRQALPYCQSHHPRHLLMLIAILFFAIFYSQPAHAASPIVVTTTSPKDDPSDGKCSLWEALQAAAEQRIFGTAQESYNECTAYAGPTTITFSGDAANGEIKLTPTDAELPWVSKEVIIVGPVTLRGSGIPATPDAFPRDTRLFRTASDGVLTLMNLTLKDCYTSGSGGCILGGHGTTINLVGVSMLDSAAESDGGAIFTDGALNITLSNFSGNKALGMNSDFSDRPGVGYGGAIGVSGSKPVTITLSNFSGNTASKGGGAIYSKSSNLSIADVVFNGNIAQAKGENQGGGALFSDANTSFAMVRTIFNGNLTPKGRGGAIYNGFDATAVFSQTAFNANISGDLVVAGQGGAVYNEGIMRVNQVTFNANIATGEGLGGAILNNRKGTLQLSNSNFFANLTPNGKGGALANTNAPNPVPSDTIIEVINVTISSNGATTGGAIYNERMIKLWNSVIEEGTTGTGGTCAGPQAVIDNGNNMQNPGLACGASITSSDPKLDLPKPNPSLALLLIQSPKDDSPLIDAGNDAICNAPPVSGKDQTDGGRDKDGDGDLIPSCDIGAVEAGRALPGFGSEPPSPGPIDFGITTINTMISATINIRETGKLPLAVVSATFAGPNANDFKVMSGNLPILIANGAPSKALVLECKPTATGERKATLSLYTDDLKNLKVDYDLVCRGTAVPAAGFSAEPIAPGPLDFGLVTINNSVNRSFKIYETGNIALNTSFASITGDHPGDFALLSGLPAIVDDGNAAGATVTVRCQPTDLGIRTAILNLSSNDTLHPSVSFDLVCTSTPPPSAALAKPGVNFPGIDGVADVAVSPDGRQVYAVAYTAGSLTQFERNWVNGQLSPGTTLNDATLAGARQLAISPDGAQVYATGAVANALTVYTRNKSTGQLTFKQALAPSTGVANLTGAFGVAVSAEGRHIYVSGYANRSINLLTRNADDSLSVVSTITSTTDLPGPRSIALSPDGKNIYVIASNTSVSGTLVVYSRNLADGSLTHLQTRREGELIGFPPFGFLLNGLAGATDVAISPDGQFVYTSSFNDSTVLLFRRDLITGRVSFVRTYRDDSNGVNGLAGAYSLAFSQDANKLFVTGFLDKAVAVFERNPATGLLTFVEAVVRDVNTGEPKLDGAAGIAVTPVGAGVYVAAFNDDTVVAFPLANPQATIDSLSPASAQVGGAAFTLLVKGKNFVQGAKVFWNNQERTTQFVNSGEIKVSIPAEDLTNAGDRTLKVVNPAPGGGDSFNSEVFKITAPNENPAPAIDYITPQSVAADVQEYTLHVYGSGFMQGSQVRFNGVDKPTSFINVGELEANITSLEVQEVLAAQMAEDSGVMAAANQPAGVSVVNPPPGGGSSNLVQFTVMEVGNNPAPSLSALQPAALVVQGAAASPLVVTVTGANFIEGSQATWNGSPRPSQVIDANTLKVTLVGGDLALVGSGVIKVSNPAPGGGESNALTFVINDLPANPVPTLTQFQPASLYAQGNNGGLQVITVIGTNFMVGSGVYLNGVLRPTQLVDVNTLRVTLTPTDTATPTQWQISVINPPPGGGASPEVAFAVQQPPPTPNPLSSLSQVTPDAVQAGGTGLVIMVRGSNFVAGVQGYWNGSSRPTQFSDATTVLITLSAADVATAGSGQISVINPPPGGGESNKLALLILAVGQETQRVYLPVARK